MFYCDECAKEKNYPETMGKSVGRCEICGKVALCNDMPSSKLPKSEPVPDELKKREIEKIAWQVFLNKTGLRFKRELTAEEMKSITEIESYVYYREQAEKIWKKKQLSILNKRYPVIEVPADGKSNWCEGGYCLCFVYSKYNGNFVLKGYLREVKEYLKKNYTHYFYNLSIWHQGFSRDIWYFWKKDIGVFDVSIRERKKGKKTEVRPYSYFYDEENKMTEEELKAKTFTFRRLPKRWIPEFDTL